MLIRELLESRPPARELFPPKRGTDLLRADGIAEETARLRPDIAERITRNLSRVLRAG